MRPVIILLLILLPFVGICYAQITWEEYYYDTGWDYTYSGIETFDGGYIAVGGYRLLYSNPFYDAADAYVIKTNAYGELDWTGIYDSPREFSWDVVYGVENTLDSCYVLVGVHDYSDSAGRYWGGVWLLKIDAEGETLWTRTYNLGEASIGRSISRTDDGGYIITGSAFTLESDDMDLYLLKTDAAGDSVWCCKFGYADRWDAGYSVCLAPDGGYVATGYTNGDRCEEASCRCNLYVVKTSSSGDSLWAKEYVESDYWRGYSIYPCHTDEGFIIGGTQRILGVAAHAYLARIDDHGDSLWMNTYWVGDGRSTCQTTDGGFMLTGTFSPLGLDYDHIRFVKTDSIGNVLWTRSFGSGKYYGYYGTQTMDGGYFVVGYQYTGWMEFVPYLIKTDTLGFTVIDEMPFQKPEKISISIFPNPFNSLLNIKLPACCYDIDVLNIQGKKVADFEGKAPQSTIIHWDAGEQASGIYFVVEKKGRMSEKVILLR